MKRIFFFACMAMAAAGCNNNTEDKDAKAADGAATTVAASTEKLDYPYTLSEPYKNWQPGSQQHVVTVMKGLKAFETGDINAAMSSFADTVEVVFDGYYAKLSNDSLKKDFIKQRAGYTSMTIKMQDWESVISADKKHEWVTMWYKQIWTDTKGKTDSLAIVDDAKIVNGKVVILDEKIQHYPAKK